MALRALIVVHRWIGVILCILFALWYASGIGMMYWGMPSVTTGDRLARAPAIDPSRVVLSPREAVEKTGESRPPAQVRLTTFDGRPAYYVGNQVVYADNGELQGPAPADMRDRAAAAWTGHLAREARIDAITEPDQWIVGSALRNLRPLWKYSWPNGKELYIGESGEVLQYTTTSSRLAAYVSAVPHWLYFTPLRTHQPFWIRFATYSAFVGTAGAIIGVVVGVWLYSPAKKYRFAGEPSRIPYRGWKRWHTVFGLVFGVATITWTFSGSLAFLPFPAPQPAQRQAEARPGAGPGQGRGQAQGRAQGQGQGRGQGPAGRRGGNSGLAAALRGRVTLDDFGRLHPRDVLSRFSDLPIREIGMTSFDGQPLYSLGLADGSSRLLSLDGTLVNGFDQARIIDIVKKTAPNPEAVDARVVDRYDVHYLDRTRQRPLPVVLALMNDAEHTRYYIDPKTATVVGTSNDRTFWRRWLYNGLHSLNFPWLYEYRPLWDIVVISFMLGGMALSLTSLTLAWRAIGRTIRRLLRDSRAVRQPAASEHLA
jgi:PepSY-associated transmembrane protein